MKQKLLSWLLIACLCIGVIPTYVLNTKAAEDTAFAELKESDKQYHVMQYQMNQLMEEGYRVATPLTFGRSDTVGQSTAKNGENISVDKLLFSTNVKFNKNAAYLMYYLSGPDSVENIKVQFNGTGTSEDRIRFFNLADYSADSEGNHSVMYWGDKENNTGSREYGGADTSTYRFYMKPSEFGLASFKGTGELTLWITTEFVDIKYNDDVDDEAIDDLKLGFWVNGRLWKDDYFYVKDCVENQYSGYVGNSDANLAITSPIMQLSDLGMVGGEYTSKNGEVFTSDLVATKKNMHKTTFQSSVRFEGVGGTLYYGSENVDDAVQLTSTSEGIQVKYRDEELVLMNKSNVGIDVLNNNFDLKLATRIVDSDSDGAEDDVELDVCVDNRYKTFTLKDATLTAHVGVKTTGNATVLLGEFGNEDPDPITWDLENGDYVIERTNEITRLSVNGVLVNGNLTLDKPGTYSVAVTENGKVYMKDVTIPDKFAEMDSTEQTAMNKLLQEGYRVVTPMTFGMSDYDGTATAAVTTESPKSISIDKLLFSAVVKYGEANTNRDNFNYLYKEGGGACIQLPIVKGTTDIRFYNYVDNIGKTKVMYVGDTGTETLAYSSGYKTLGKKTAEVTAYRGNEVLIWITTDFVKAPWLTEGEPMDDLRIGIWFNGKLWNNTYFYVLDCKEDQYQGYVECGLRNAISSPIMELNNMEMVGGEYASKDGEVFTSDLVATKNMNRTTFQTGVRFEGVGGTLYYGSANVDDAVQLTSTSDGIQVKYRNEDLVLMNKANVGIDVLNNNFDLKLATRIVDSDSDGAEDDVELDVCVDNRYKTFTLKDATLTAHVGVKTTGNATVLVGEFGNEAPEKISWDLENGAYIIEKTTDMTRLSVDGVRANGNLTLNQPGTYSVAVTENGKVYMKDITIEAAPTTRYLTFADFGYTDKKYEGGLSAGTLTTIASDKVNIVSLADSEFSGYIQLHTDGRTVTNAATLLLGGDDSASNGVSIQFMPTGELKVDTTKVAGKQGAKYTYTVPDGAFETKFKFTISFATDDVEDDGHDDLLMKVYVNDELCSAEDTYIMDYIPANFVGKMRTYGLNSTDTDCYQSVAIESCEMPYNYTTTFADYGISEQTYGSNSTDVGTAFSGTMEHMKFSGHVTLGSSDASGGYTGIVYGYNDNTSSGLRLKIDALSGNVFIDNYLNSVGRFLNHTDEELSNALPTDGNGFDISFNTIPWDYDGNGLATDGKIEIRVDGKLLQDKYFIIGGIFAEGVTLTNRIKLIGQEEFGGTATMTVASENSDTKRLRKLELADFALADGTYETQNYTAGKGPSSLLNTILEVNLNVTESTSGSQIHYAIPSDASDGWSGTSLAISGSEIEISNADGILTVNSTSIKASEAQKDSFYGETLKLGLTIERVDFHGDNNYDDAKLGIWLNGKLYRNYYYLDGANAIGKGMSIMSYVDEADQGIAKVTISDVIESTANFTKTLGLADMNKTGVAAGTYGYYPGNPETKTLGTKSSWKNTGDMDGAIFSTSIRFSSKNILLMYGCSGVNNMGSHCVWVRSAGNEPENLQVSFNGANAYTLEAGVAGVKFYDNTFKLSISSRTVDSDGDNLFDDLEVGFWFNDVLYGNTYIYFNSFNEKLDHNDVLDPNIAVRNTSADVNKQGYLVLGEYTQQEATEVVYCADKFAYFVDGDEVTVDGKAQGTSWNTQVPGEYAVTFTNTTSMGTSTFKQNVLVYKTNDVSVDDVVDVRDLVAMKRLAAGKRAETSNAGKKAVGYAENSEWYTKETQENMHTQLLADKNILQAKKMSDDILGETGSLTPDGKATYITNLDLTEEGTSVISISDVADEASRNYTTNVAALNGSGLDFVLDFDTDREIKVLQISDPQVIVRAEVSEYKGTQENKDIMLYNELRKLVATEKPDLILIAGDIIFGRYDTDGTLLNEIIAAMDSFKIPWAPIFGNHDNESPMGVTWQCNRFIESTYCLFNRRHDIGGNGNYTIGIAVKGKLQRTIFMMDTNGCSYLNKVTNDADKEAVTESFVLHDEQIAWYRTTAERMKQFAGEDVPSFLCTHVAPGEVGTAFVEKGYQEKTDIDLGSATGIHKYTAGEIVRDDDKSTQDSTVWTYNPDELDNFGFKNSTTTTTGSMNEFILPYLKEAGTDGTFFGHVHTNSLSVEWEGIRWTFGLKTGRYDGNSNETGGTVITLNGKEFDVNHTIMEISERSTK